MQIDLITNTTQGLNIGSLHQAEGIAESLERTLQATGQQVTVNHIDLQDMAKLKATLRDAPERPEPHVVIGIGDDGVKAFLQLQPDPAARHTFVLAGHEVPKGAEALKDKIDLLAVPEHIASVPDMGDTRIVRTQGVAHAVTQEKVDAAYAQWKDTFATDGKPVVVVLLGGAVDGKDYAPEEARKLGELAAQKAQAVGGTIYATHSPRASKEAIDAFNAGVRQAHGAFLPFDGKSDAVPFQALLGLVKADPMSALIATGDSVSMPSEAASILRADQLTLFPMSNENADNTRFVQWMHDKGLASLLGKPVQMPAPDSLLQEPKLRDANRPISDAVREITLDKTMRNLGLQQHQPAGLSQSVGL